MFRTISQTAIHYRASPLSEGRAGRVRGGDRLPWVSGRARRRHGPGSDNFAPLASLDWQVHIYGERTRAGARGGMSRAGSRAARFPLVYRSAPVRVCERGAVYLVRPDGYVGLADPDADPAKLERYLESRGLRPLNTSETRATPPFHDDGGGLRVGRRTATYSLGGDGTEDDMATILGGSGADALAGTPDADLILGFDTDGPTNQVATIEAIRVAAGLSQPVFATAPPDNPDRLALVERAGRIQTLDLRSGAVAPTAFLDLSGQVATAGEEGLLGLAFHPAYAANGRFYVYLSNLAGDSEVREYRAVAGDPNRADPASERLILRIDQPDAFSNHKGGWIGFGPDGMLYVATGDGGGGGDPFGNGQNPNTLLGKILRLDVGGADAFPLDPARNYAIPPDNPFAASGGGAPENWALGCAIPGAPPSIARPARCGSAMSARARFEEIDLGIAGANHGWNLARGFRALRGDRRARRADAAALRLWPGVRRRHLRRLRVSRAGGRSAGRLPVRRFRQRPRLFA